jgi:hypothetical protein
MPAPAEDPQGGAPAPAVPIARRIARQTSTFPLWILRTAADARLPMVGWYEPGQLVSTGLKSLASYVVGERSDRRIVQALESRRQAYYDHAVHYRDGARGPQPEPDRPRDELWIDFISDTGDGWNSTYAVAHAASQPALRVAAPHGPVDLPRGDLLVFGGDEVYPAPSREEYQRRLVAPFSAAFGDDLPAERPQVYAIPGNHDWYDGLSAFTRLFCSDIGGRRFAGWWTRQRRSYFVLRLPHRWWLVGSDAALQGDIDVPQMEYFRAMARRMQPGDKVVLCLSKPAWIEAEKYRALGQVFAETDLIYLREEVFASRGVEVKVHLSGDSHHYRRHEETAASAAGAPPTHKIVAGGGGAFLHPTHEEDFSRLTEHSASPSGRTREFVEKAIYPTPTQSRALAYGNLLFPWRNRAFGVIPGTIYLLSGWLARTSLGDDVPDTWGAALEATVRGFETHPGLALWSLALVAALLVATDTHSRLYRVLGGLSHAAAHFAAMLSVIWAAGKLAELLVPPDGLVQAAVGGLGVFAGGWVVGSFVVGVYLLVSVNVFGRHSEEAFSALRVEDYKSFLRLHVAKDGTLTIWPLKIERVPRRWRVRRDGDATPSRVVAEDPLVVETIEPPIRITDR